MDILVGSEDACTLKREFAVLGVDERKATELLLVDGLDHCRVHWGQRGLLGREVAVKVVGVHLGFLKTTFIPGKAFEWPTYSWTTHLLNKCASFED